MNCLYNHSIYESIIHLNLFVFIYILAIYQHLLLLISIYSIQIVSVLNNIDP